MFTNQGNQRVTTATTDGSGIYRQELPPGTYTIRFELSGFARQETPNVEVQFGRIYDVDASLKVGNVSEAVQVTAENAPLVDTRSTMIAHNVTAEQIDRLPKGRSFQSIALTAPSVNSGEIEGGFQVNGASGAENAFTVDGVVTNSLINGSSRQNTVFEYIQEVQVKTTGIPAEFGGALGGVISAVTKSGGNIFTGETHYYLDGSPLSAGPVKRLVLSPIDDKTVQYWQDDEAVGRPPGVRRIDRRPDRPRQTVLLRIVLAARQPAREQLQVLERHRGRRDRPDVQADPGVWQGQRRQPQSKRLRVDADHAVSYVTGTLPAYNGFGNDFLASSKAANEPNKDRGPGADAGERERQRRRRHLERRVRDVPRRLLPRSLHRHRHSADDQLHLSDTDVELRGHWLRSAREPGGSAAHSRTPRARRSRTSTRPSARCSTPITTTRSRVPAGTR